jgi:hypothetical protein
MVVVLKFIQDSTSKIVGSGIFVRAQAAKKIYKNDRIFVSLPSNPDFQSKKG